MIGRLAYRSGAMGNIHYQRRVIATATVELRYTPTRWAVSYVVAIRKRRGYAAAGLTGLMGASFRKADKRRIIKSTDWQEPHYGWQLVSTEAR